MPQQPITLPIVRRRPLDLPPELADLRRESPIVRMSFPDGHVGWLITTYDRVREVLSDPRFSRRSELLHRQIARPGGRTVPPPAPPGFFLGMDPPEHTRLRRHLTGQFTVRRMNQLRQRIEQIADDCLTAVLEQGPPVDLVEAFALPVPSLVICELLGVSYDERDRFQQDSAKLFSLNSTKEEASAAFASLTAFIHSLVPAKRERPTDDMLSGLAAGGEVTDEEIAGMGMLLLFAGHETTASMLGLGVYALLCNPEQMARLRADPALVDPAVEELLRHLTVVHLGTLRTALEDVEIDGHLIRAGECVSLSLAAANHDPGRFDDADRLDVTRSAVGHMGFGHGIHQCLGQQLARVILRVGYAKLLERLPELRLAVPADAVPTRGAMSIYGVHRLPVAW